MDLMELLPDYYKDNTEMEKLQKILSEDVDNAVNGLDAAIEECFVNTASYMLSRYEKMHGLRVDESLSDESRREKIKAKMVGTGTFTKAMLINTLKAFDGGQSMILEEFNNYKFIIKFNDYNRVPSLESIVEIHKITDELKPTHLNYEHTFTYNWWGMQDTGVWNDGGTWDDLRNYKEV